MSLTLREVNACLKSCDHYINARQLSMSDDVALKDDIETAEAALAVAIMRGREMRVECWSVTSTGRNQCNDVLSLAYKDTLDALLAGGLIRDDAAGWYCECPVLLQQCFRKYKDKLLKERRRNANASGLR